MADIPEGELYSRLYVKAGDSVPDSAKFRRRISGFFQSRLYSFGTPLTRQFGAALRSELGVPLSSGLFENEFEKFFLGGETVDFLNALTVVWRVLAVEEGEQAARTWQGFVARSLSEENLDYTCDPKCGIHRKIDVEFERNKVSAVAALTQDRYRAVRHAAESAFEQLQAVPVDGKGAARNIFEAAESMVKIVIGSGAALTESLVNKELRAIVDRQFEGDQQLKSTAGALISGFGKWVMAVHPFRHGHDRDQPLMLPDDVAILCVSQGAGYLRWLVDVDNRQLV